MPIRFFPDRYPKDMLARDFPDVVKSLRARWTVMMENSQQTIAWVGVAQAKGKDSVFFLPHGAPSGHQESEKFASKLMAAIVRFAREHSREGDRSEDEGATQAALLADIAADFRDHGLYATREKIRSRDDGKPDWARTVKSRIAYPASNGSPVYCEISSTRYSSFATNIIAKIQAQIVSEISENHGWWLERYFGAREMPDAEPLNDWPREVWPRLLRMARRELFQTRAIRLVQMLLDYLESAAKTGVGNIVCGISDFATMWETILRRTLEGVDDGWNSKLPGPHYFDDGEHGKPSGRMQLDIVIRRDARLAILDAKYYRSTSVELAPGLADISKQIVYQKALESTGEANGLTITNAFLFPARETHRDAFRTIRFMLPDGSMADGFSPIECQYVSIAEVVDAYASGAKLADQQWLVDLQNRAASP